MIRAVVFASYIYKYVLLAGKLPRTLVFGPGFVYITWLSWARRRLPQDVFLKPCFVILTMEVCGLQNMGSLVPSWKICRQWWKHSVNITCPLSMLLGLFILHHIPVSDPWPSDISMTLGHYILDVKLNIKMYVTLKHVPQYQYPTSVPESKYIVSYSPSFLQIISRR